MCSHKLIKYWKLVQIPDDAIVYIKDGFAATDQIILDSGNVVI